MSTRKPETETARKPENPASAPKQVPDQERGTQRLNPFPTRIVLTGFMAAGKTTVGRLLADRLQWPFLDVDAVIEAETSATVAEVFRDRGEPWFRAREHSTIQRLLLTQPLILALGGGAIEHPHTRELLIEDTAVHLVNLEASLETTWARCGTTDVTRPVLQNRDALEARYLFRLPLYRQSHQTVIVDHLSPAEVADAILTHLGVLSPA